MSYQALYRKWRPKTFDEVKGQDAIVTTLKNQIASGRIGHAYLFCGTRGTGKTSVAKILARAVNCEHAEGGNPCNTCDVCRGILSESSMNVMEIDAASNNGVDNIRDIREQVQYPPTEGRYKVFIIDEVHMLSTGAFNALLKTLEEPPEYVIFILATTEVHKIPVTVLSRCQRYDFKRISVDTIAARLRELCDAEGIRIDGEALRYLAKSADGAMRDALSLLDECVAFHPEEMITYDKVLEILGAADTGIFADLFDAVAQAKAMDALQIVEEAVNEGKELSQFATDFLWFMRNILVIKSTDHPEKIIDASSENLEVMRQSAKGVTRDALMRFIRVIAELINKMRYSSQKRVLLELALLKLITPAVAEDFEEEADDAAVLAAGASAARRRRAGGTGTGAGTAAAAAKSDAGTESGPVRVTLEKAKYEDLMKLREEWNSVVESMSGSNRRLLRDTTLEPGDGDLMFVVFEQEGLYEIGKRDSTLEEAAKLARERLGKSVTFRAKLKDGTLPDTIYVTEEELSRLIHMEIEIEE